MAKTKSGDLVLKDDQKVIIGQKELTRRLLEFLTSLSYKNGQLYYGDELVVDLASIGTDLVPDRTFARSVGTETKQWKEVRVGPGPIYLSNIPIILNRISEILIQSGPNQNLTLESQGASAVILRSNEMVQVDSNFDVTGQMKVQSKDVALIESDGKLPMEIIPELQLRPTVYQVATSSEVQSITDMKAGDMCLVAHKTSYIYNGTEWLKMPYDSEDVVDEGDIIFGGNSNV